MFQSIWIASRAKILSFDAFLFFLAISIGSCANVGIDEIENDVAGGEQGLPSWLQPDPYEIYRNSDPALYQFSASRQENFEESNVRGNGSQVETISHADRLIVLRLSEWQAKKFGSSHHYCFKNMIDLAPLKKNGLIKVAKILYTTELSISINAGYPLNFESTPNIKHPLSEGILN
jgi:hypothetical protein